MALALLESEELLSPKNDLSSVKNFVNLIKSRQCLRNKNPKELQKFISRINDCLHHQNGKKILNGLLPLEILIDQCNGDVFSQYGYGFITTLVKILEKKKLDSQIKMKTSIILRNLLKFTPQFSEISRLITSFAPTIISALLTNESNESILCLTKLMKNYPGCCGASATKIESCLTQNFDVLNPDIVAGCWSYLPRLGGSGREGIHHKEAWSKQFLKLTNTYRDILKDISDNLNMKYENDERSQPDVYLLPVVKTGNSLYHRTESQIERLKRISLILIRYLKVPFNHTKSFHPDDMFRISLSLMSMEQESTVSHESLISQIAVPQILEIHAIIMQTYLSVLGRDLILYIGHILRYVHHILNSQEVITTNYCDFFFDLAILFYLFFRMYRV